MEMAELITRQKVLNRCISILFGLLTLASIRQWLNINIGNTTIWWFFETIFLLGTIFLSLYDYIIEKYQWNKKRYKVILVLVYALKNKNKIIFAKAILYFKHLWNNRVNKNVYPIPIIIYLLWILLSIILGCFKATGYWDWKTLYNNSMIYTLPVIVVYFSSPANIKYVCQTWIIIAMSLFCFLLPFMQLECPAKFLVPFAFFIVFWPYYNRKGVIACLVAFICVFMFGTIGSRSSVIRFLASLLFSFMVLFRQYINRWFFTFTSLLLLFTPIVLFWLGVTGHFNIFKIGEYIDLDVKVESAYKDGATENLSSDTRTFLYEETLGSAIEHDYWLIGNSLSQGYYSNYFGHLDEVEGRGMRNACEVGILNIFTNLGIIGVLIYMSIYIYTIINVFINSNNKSLYVIAVLLAFRWLFSFLEEFTRFDLNTIFLWIEIAMCNSPYFLRMTDAQFKMWARNLLFK